MKSITKFQANDGTEFSSEEKCVAHEALCAEIDGVMSALPKLPKDDGCNFANGHGYIQHDPATLLAVRHALLNIAQRLHNHRWITESIADPTVHSSWAGRIIGETSDALSSAWHRIACTDKDMREWGQPYYAEHPDQGEQVQINKVGVLK